MKLYLFISSVLLFVLTCTLSADIKLGGSIYDSKINNEIDVKIRNMIHNTNNRIINSISTNDPNIMLDLFTNEAKKAGARNLEGLYLKLNQTIKESKQTIFFDSLVTVTSAGSNIIRIPSETKEEFYINLTVGSESLLSIKSQKYFVSLVNFEKKGRVRMLAFIYRLIDSVWRLQVFYAGDYKLAKKSAIDWYQEAMTIKESKHFVPALMRLKYAKIVLKPTPFIEFRKEKQILDLIDELSSKSREGLIAPFMVPKGNNLIVYSIDSLIFNDKILPLVKFVTKTPFSSEKQLKNEAKTVAIYLRKSIPGIFDYNEDLLLRAYNEKPINENKLYKTFGVVLKSKDIKKNQ